MWYPSRLVAHKRRHVSVEPKGLKTHRHKYSIMTTLWLLGKLHQPRRSIHKYFGTLTFVDLLDTFLGEKNFNHQEEINGELLLVPWWMACMTYEYEL